MIHFSSSSSALPLVLLLRIPQRSRMATKCIAPSFCFGCVVKRGIAGSAEHILTESRSVPKEVDFCEVGAGLECHEANISNTLRERDGGQAGTTIKVTHPNAGNAVRDCDSG